MNRQMLQEKVALNDLRQCLGIRKRLLLFETGDALGDVGGIGVSVFSGPEVRVTQIYLHRTMKQMHPVWL